MIYFSNNKSFNNTSAWQQQHQQNTSYLLSNKIEHFQNEKGKAIELQLY